MNRGSTRRIIGITAVLGLIWCSLAVSFCTAESIQSLKERARKYYRGIDTEQSYTKALQLYLQAARQGDSEAQYISGSMYFKGLGAKKDMAMAFKLLHQAAMSGKTTPESEQIIGQAFLLGSGVPKNYDKAVEWYDRAAKDGNSEAQNELGFMYMVGRGVEQDAEKAAEYFLQAANRGLAIAQYNIGILYYTGNGFKENDLLRSYAWFNLAAAGGHQPAAAARTYLESLLSPKELVAAQALSNQLSHNINP